MLILLAFATLVALSLPSTSFIHPSIVPALTAQEVAPLECEPKTGIKDLREAERPSRSATFRVGGEFNCRRPVFTADERNSLVERLLAAETQKASVVARSVQRYEKESKDVLRLQIVTTESIEIASKLAVLYSNELTATLGSGRVSRQLLVTSEPPEPPYLRIEVNPSEDPRWMTKAQLVSKDERGELKWRDL